MLNLTVLVDNNTFIDQYLAGEPAVSYYIESDGQKILFDAGYSDVFLTNANRLGIDLSNLDAIVLSHGHLDHTWGLQYLVRMFAEKWSTNPSIVKPELIAHPQVFANRHYKKDPEIGSLLKEENLVGFFNIQLGSEPVFLTQRLIFLGEIERKNNFEAQKNISTVRLKSGEEIPDMVMDDSALVYISERGLVIITGCSHAGICNIVEHAKKITGETRILDIIGGLHLQRPTSEQMQGTLEYFRQNNVVQLHACHCTDLQSKIQMASVANIIEVGCGLKLRY